MNRKRRITFQLTPLLDLLLIVIFAQYMEMRDASARVETEARENAQQRIADVQTAVEQELQQATIQYERKLSDSEQKQQFSELAFQDILRQQEEAGNVLAELFNVPADLIQETLKPRNPAQPRSAEDSKRLRAEFRDLSKRRGRDVVRHLLTYEQLRKRCDVWEVYVNGNGNIEFSSGFVGGEFRCATVEEFETRMYQQYKQFDEPKQLVVILFSYGDAQAGIRQIAIDGMPGAIELMRRDRSDRNWFEFAILGFSPDGPTLRER